MQPIFFNRRITKHFFVVLEMLRNCRIKWLDPEFSSELLDLYAVADSERRIIKQQHGKRVSLQYTLMHSFSVIMHSWSLNIFGTCYNRPILYIQLTKIISVKIWRREYQDFWRNIFPVMGRKIFVHFTAFFVNPILFCPEKMSPTIFSCSFHVVCSKGNYACNLTCFYFRWDYVCTQNVLLLLLSPELFSFLCIVNLSKILLLSLCPFK